MGRRHGFTPLVALLISLVAAVGGDTEVVFDVDQSSPVLFRVYDHDGVVVRHRNGILRVSEQVGLSHLSVTFNGPTLPWRVVGTVRFERELTLNMDAAKLNKQLDSVSRALAAALSIEPESIPLHQAARHYACTSPYTLLSPASFSSAGTVGSACFMLEGTGGDVLEALQLNSRDGVAGSDVDAPPPAPSSALRTPSSGMQCRSTLGSRQLERAGAHRLLSTSLSVDCVNGLCPDGEVVEVFVVEHFDSGIFIDEYEVDELARFGANHVRLHHTIDLEKPAYESSQNYVLAHQSSAWRDTSSTVTLQVPVHFRYQAPSPADDLMASLVIRPPRAVYIQSASSGLVRCEFAQNSPKEVAWRSIGVSVPVGQLPALPSVTLWTMSVTVAGSVAVLVTAVHKKWSEAE